MIAQALALALLASQAGAPLVQDEWQASRGDGAPLADEGQASYGDDDVEDAPHLFVTAWGGEALDEAGSGRSSALLGGEVSWAFSALDLGVAGYGYRRLADAEREWTPVALVRLVQRFETRTGLEATFALGVGAGRPDHWTAWYQVALGGRASFGPVFVAGELSFEQNELLRLAAGLGLAF